MISEITLAMVAQLELETFMQTIHPFPTQGEATRTTAGELAKAALAGV